MASKGVPVVRASHARIFHGGYLTFPQPQLQGRGIFVTDCHKRFGWLRLSEFKLHGTVTCKRCLRTAGCSKTGLRLEERRDEELA